MVEKDSQRPSLRVMRVGSERETVELEAVGQRLSHRLIPRITIAYGDESDAWSVVTVCRIPRTASEEKRAGLKADLERKSCHGQCRSLIDRKGVDTIIALLQSDSIHKLSKKTLLIR